MNRSIKYANNASTTKPYAVDEWRRISDDVVVTRDKSGEPRSFFREDSWNVDAYATGAKYKNLNFRGHVPSKSSPSVCADSKQQWKQVMYLLMHKASETMPATDTLQGKMKQLRPFVRFSIGQGLTLYQAMSNAKSVIKYISMKGNATNSVRLHGILVQLHRLGPEVTGLTIPFAQLHTAMLKRAKSRKGALQHPVMPTRIYQNFLATCERELEMLEGVAASLEQTIRNTYDCKPLNPSSELVNVAGHFNYDASTQFSAFLNEVLALCQIIAIAFSGMRAKEADTLPYDCVQVNRQDGVDHYVIAGITTKFSDGRPKRARWVTSRIAYRAIRFAQRISSIAHSQHGEDDHKTSSDGNHLLFCRTGLHHSSEYVRDRVATNLDAGLQSLCSRACATICVEDIAELKHIDPHRAWETESGFAVGEQWPFTKHQLRRSLALYAHRSGLVSLPSLKRQLHHITIEMSRYYARGSAFAKSFIEGDKQHFARDWANSQGLSDYLAYAAQVLFSDERLFGGHASWVASKTVKQSPVSVFSRDKTISMFQRGELAYQETALGGCTSIEECKTSPLNWIPIECLEKDCKNLVGSPTKLQRVIVTQEKRVAKLATIDSKSVEYRMELQTLTTLHELHKKLAKRK
jgi:hypothetical protein